jgi:hypothetical protein
MTVEEMAKIFEGITFRIPASEACLKAPMKVSIARLNETKQLRDAALTVLNRNGIDTIIGDRDERHRTWKIEIEGLSIMHSPHAGEQLLDIWQGEKVFSVAWDATGSLTVVSFRPGECEINLVP